MKIRLVTSVACLLSMAFIIIACGKKSSGDATADVCVGVSASFSANVMPLMLTKCSYNSNCHGTGSTNSGGVLVNYTQISNRSSTIKTQVAAGSMPQGGTLSTAEKNIILCWVNNGAMNN